MVVSKIIIVPGPNIPAQPWWNDLHSVIINAFRYKQDTNVFPLSWGRLDGNPTIAAHKFGKEEIGPKGHLVVIFDGERPIACGGVLPFKGDNWIDRVEDDTLKDAKISNGELTHPGDSSPEREDESIADWEICCFCVQPSSRGRGLSQVLLDEMLAFIKSRGAKRLMSNYVIEETGKFWPKMGFVTMPGAGGILRKGYTHTAGMEGLKADIHFAVGERAV